MEPEEDGAVAEGVEVPPVRPEQEEPDRDTAPVSGDREGSVAASAPVSRDREDPVAGTAPDSPGRVAPVTGGQVVETRVTGLAAGGHGVARVDGFVLLVRRGLPGEHIRARVTALRGSYAEAEVAERLAPAPGAVIPPCSLFDRCGGCQWMHLDYQAQLAAKRAIVEDSLGRIGGVTGFTLHPVLPSPSQLRYRNKLELAFSEGPDGLSLGFHAAGSETDIVDVPACLIGSERMERVARWTRQALEERGCGAGGDGPARLRHLVLREGAATGEMLANLITGAGEIPGEKELARMLLAEHPFVVGLVRTIVSAGRKGGGRSEQVLSGKGTFTEKLGGLVFEIAPTAFFQVNTAQAENLYSRAVGMAGEAAGGRVLDLYCGVGGLSLHFARRAREVTGFESAPESVRCARQNARTNGLDNARFTRGEARREMRRYAAGAPRRPASGRNHVDLVCLNPPRSGVHRDIVTSIGEIAPGRVIYVSCNPPTLARDAARLDGAGYRLAEVQPVDMFPHSWHVETIAVFDRT